MCSLLVGLSAYFIQTFNNLFFTTRLWNRTRSFLCLFLIFLLLLFFAVIRLVGTPKSNANKWKLTTGQSAKPMHLCTTVNE